MKNIEMCMISAHVGDDNIELRDYKKGSQVKLPLIFVSSSLFLLSIGINIIPAQEIIPATGGNAVSIGGTVNYTVGQVSYVNKKSSGTLMTQGVQQSFDILVLTETELAGINLIAFPNPVVNVLKLVIDNYKTGTFLYQLYDLNGILLDANKIEEKETTIHVRDQIPAAFFLKISDGRKVLKVFNIIKN